MASDHTSPEAMRAYLLGLLSDDQAAALEQEYFVNRSFFLKVQSAETALINDYLENRLTDLQRQRFEKLYLEVPDLRRKVEEARRLAAHSQPVRRLVWMNLRLSLAVALVLVLALGIWIYHSRITKHAELAGQMHSPTKPSSAVASPEGVFAVYLAPGITKGTNSRPVQFEQPGAGSTLDLILELPGQTSSVERTVEISIVKPDDSLGLVWSSPGPIKSSSAEPQQSLPTLAGSVQHNQATQTLVLSLPGSLFQPGDYLVNAAENHGGNHEIYAYRVIRVGG